MNFEKASPRPWKRDKHELYSSHPRETVTMEQLEANAALIVAAVNSYEKMREALEMSRDALLRARAKIVAEFMAGNNDWSKLADDILRPAHIATIEALAAAKETP